MAMNKITFFDKIPSSLSSSAFASGNPRGNSSSDATTTGATVAGTASQSEQVVVSTQAQAATTAPTQTQQASTSEMDQKALKEALSTLQGDNTSLTFSIDDTSGSVVIKVIDKVSGDVVRQIPAEEVLVLRQQQVEKSRGGLIDKVL